MESRKKGGTHSRWLRVAAKAGKTQVASSFETPACGGLLRMRLRDAALRPLLRMRLRDAALRPLLRMRLRDAALRPLLRMRLRDVALRLLLKDEAMHEPWLRSKNRGAPTASSW
jgi:hypothetical protein